MRELLLEVLASTSIKRRKPWPAIAFMGEWQESLLLLDVTRVSVLYVPSGKTKRRIPKLQSLLPDTKVLTTSRNGNFLVGMLRQGDFYIWHKESDVLRHIQGLPELAVVSDNDNKTEQPNDRVLRRVWVSGDGSKLVVWASPATLVVWEQDPRYEEGRGTALSGTWSHVLLSCDAGVPAAMNIELDMDAVFIGRQPVGSCCLCSMVFRDGDILCVTTLVIKWFDPQQVYSYSQPTYHTEWMTWSEPLHSLLPESSRLRCPGMYVSRYSNDGQLLAVVVNATDTHASRLLYVSPWSGVMVVVDLMGLGAREAVYGDQAKTYWVCGLQWTPDDLHLCLVTQQGYFSMLTRLGEPLLICTQGQSINMGPRLFLPLHPRITIQSSNEAMKPDIADPMRQRYSVSIHPRQPLVLVSDGYMVTALQRPTDITCLSLINAHLTDAAQQIRRLKDLLNFNSSLFDTLRNKQKGPNGRKSQKRTSLFAGEILKRKSASDAANGFNFEEPCKEALEDTSEGVGGPVLDALNGKLVFGDVENMNHTVDFSKYIREENLGETESYNRAVKSLMAAWGLAVSHSGVWTGDHEDSLAVLSQNLNRLATLILHSNPEQLSLLWSKIEKTKLQQLNKKNTSNVALSIVLTLFHRMLQLLEMDSLQRNLQITSLEMVHSLGQIVLSAGNLGGMLSGLGRVQACYGLLSSAEMAITKTYLSLPGDFHTNNHPHKPGHDAALLVSPHLYATSVNSKLIRNKFSEKLMKDGDGKSVIDSTLLAPNTRLERSWLVLYRHTLQFYKQMLRASLNQQATPQKQKNVRKNFKKTLHLLCALQCRLSAGGTTVPPSVQHKEKIISGDRSCIEGRSDQAITDWLRHAETCSDAAARSHMMGQLLHGALYGMLLQQELVGAMEMVALMMEQRDPRKTSAIWRHGTSYLSLLQQVPSKDRIKPPEILTSRVGRHLALSLARIMAAFFSNLPLYVFPPHAAYRLPPLHHNLITADGVRVLPLYHEELSTVIRQSQLGEAWTPERALHYLMLAGSLSEGVWFLKSLGDWKAAFILAVACHRHTQLCPELYERKKKLLLPDDLEPASILRDQLRCLVQGPDELAKTSPTGALHYVTEDTDLDLMMNSVRDLLTAAAVCQLDIVPWLLNELMSRLKMAAGRFTALVPEGLYLPAPPVYCPQPAADSQEDTSDDVSKEVALRRQVSSLILLINMVLVASHAALPAATWYAQRVLSAFTTNLQTFKRKSEKNVVMDIEVLHESYLSSQSSFQGNESESTTHLSLTCLRDLCTITWMLYARDKLSLALRRKARMARDETVGRSDNKGDPYLQQCQSAVQWARQLLPFSNFLEDPDGQLYSAFLSLLIELPANQETAKILAEHCYNAECLEPLVQEKLAVILHDWKNVMVDSSRKLPDDDVMDSPRSLPGQSPRGVCLSVYYHSKAKTINKLFNKRVKMFGAYEEYTFDRVGGDGSSQSDLDGVTSVGSRFCEGSQEYLQFLDTFYAISYDKALGYHKDKQDEQWPLFGEYSQDIHRRELATLSHKSLLNSHQMVSPRGRKGRAAINVESPRRAPTSPRRQVNRQISSPAGKPPMRRVGLFRSKSLTDVRGSAHKISLPGPMPPARAISQDDLDTDNVPQMTLRQGSPVLSCKSTCNVPKSAVTDDDKVPLSQPLVPQWKLDNMMFPDKFNDLELELEWLNTWARRNHTLLPTADDSKTKSPQKSAMKLRVSPRFMLYSLWLVENCYYKNAMVPTVPPEVTVAMVHKTDMVAPDSPTTLCCSPHRSSPSPKHNTPPNEHSKKKKKKGKKNTYQGDYSTPPPSYKFEEAEIFPVVEKTVPTMMEEVGPEEYQEVQPGEDQLHEVWTSEDQPDTFQSMPSSDAQKRKLSFRLPDESIQSVSQEETPRCGCREEAGSGSEDETLELSSLLVDDEVRHTLLQSLSTLNSRGPLKLEDLSRKTPLHEVSPLDLGDTQDTMTLTSTKMDSLNTTLRHRQDDLQSPDPRASRGDSNLATELQGIVRAEMRRIMEAQQRGILAMMGALDDPNSNATPSSHYVAHQPDIAVNNMQEEMARLHVDRPNSDKSSNGTPLNLADLTQGSSEGRPWTPEPVNAPYGVPQRLQGDPADQDRNERLLYRDRSENKENFDVSSQQQQPFYQLHTRPPLPQDPSNGNQRYSSLMSALQDMNKDLLQYAPGPEMGPTDRQPKLLTMPSDRDQNEHIITLPQFTPGQAPRPAWMDSSQAPGTFPTMPLLTLNNNKDRSFRNPDYHQDPPERDTDHTMPRLLQESAAFRMQATDEFFVPFPMLRIPTGESLPIDRGTGTLPGFDLPNEMKAYHENQLREEEKRRKELNEEVAGELHHKLQQIPSKPSDKRRKRRKDKKQKDVRKIKLEPRSPCEEDTDVAVDSLPERDQEPMEETLNQTTTSASLEHTPKSKNTSHKSSSRKKNKKDKKPPKVEELHSGYALTPGLFDEYLDKQSELGSALDTNASIQYQAAMGIQPTPTPVLKKDMYTETETPREDQQTAMGKDSGTSPVGEALQKHYRARTNDPGSILPPDVFLGLQFGQQPTAKGADGAPAFINVVDITGEMAEMTSREPSATPQQAHRASPQQVSFRPQRQPRADSGDEDEVERRPDATTTKLLGPSTLTDTHLDPSGVTRGNRYKTKSQIRRRLEDMNDQFNAIAAMQENIERDFKSTNLLMNTVEELGEAFYPERLEPSAKVLGHFDGEQEGEEEESELADTIKKSPVRDSERKPPSPRKSQDSPRRTTPRQQKDEESNKDKLLQLSGLSGISDIVGEMLDKGELDADQVGLSHIQSQQLINKARDSARDGVRLSSEQLEKIFKDYSSSPRAAPTVKEQKNERTAKEQRELKLWMAERKAAKQREYTRTLKELREREKKPFHSTQSSSTAPPQGTAKLREERKKVQQHEFEEKRRQQASKLMGDILGDTLELPEEPTLTETRLISEKPKSAHTGTSARSPARTRSWSPAGRKPKSTIPHRHIGEFDEFEQTIYGGYMEEHILPDQDTLTPKDNQRGRSAAKNASVKIAQPAVRSRTQSRDRENIDEKPVKPRPFTDLVRLQRPEATKPKPVVLPHKTYPAKTSQSSGLSSPQLSALSHKDGHKMQDSKRLTGTYKLQERKAPRLVKTYTERLQEMRRSRPPVLQHYTGPLPDRADTRVMRGGRLTEVKPQNKSRKQPRQSLSYTQQLQQLQPPKDQYRTMQDTVAMPTLRKWHRPAHKPKTYAEQLQELQPRDDGRIYRSPPKHVLARTRPYGDPYSHLPADDASVLSSWSVESDVQKLVYDQETSRMESAAEMTDLDISELRDLADLDPDEDYSQLVDIREIAEAASVSGSSIMSFIDWDQVDQLIADAT